MGKAKRTEETSKSNVYMSVYIEYMHYTYYFSTCLFIFFFYFLLFQTSFAKSLRANVEAHEYILAIYNINIPVHTL